MGLHAAGAFGGGFGLLTIGILTVLSGVGYLAIALIWPAIWASPGAKTDRWADESASSSKSLESVLFRAAAFVAGSGVIVAFSSFTISGSGLCRFH
jgi:hypothetical protein